MASLVDLVLAQQDSDDGQQPDDVILGYCRRYRFLSAEPVGELFKLFSKQSVGCLLHVTHGF
ncbi:MAG: hypothetical protein ACT4NP_18600 [Pseudonocardiales bacterium]